MKPCLKVFSPRKAEESVQHAKDRGAFAVEDAVENFANFIGMVDDDVDWMTRFQRVQSHHILHIPRNKLRIPGSTCCDNINKGVVTLDGCINC